MKEEIIKLIGLMQEQIEINERINTKLIWIIFLLFLVVISQ